MRPVPCSLAVVLVGLVGLVGLGGALAGCGGDDASSPAASRTPAGAIAGPAEEAEILKAYEAHWTPFYEFINSDGPGNIGDYFAGHRRDDLPRQVVNIADQGLEVRGEPDLSPGPVRVAGDDATFTDCQRDETYAIDRSTGEEIVSPNTALQAVSVEMRRIAGGWRVSSVVYGEDGSCTR